MLYLAAGNVTTHGTCHALRKVTLETGDVSTVVAPVDDPESQGAFPGLYNHSLPKRCFLSDSWVLIDSPWGSVNRMLRVNVHSGKVEKVTVKGIFIITGITLRLRRLLVERV